MAKKHILGGIAAAMLTAAMSVCCFAGTISLSTSWSFTSLTAGEQTSDYTYNNLVIKATAEKTVKLNSEIQLSGSGSTTYRCINFGVVGACTINVNCKGGDPARILQLADQNGNILDTIEAGTSYADGTLTYTGSGEELYIYSKNSGINIKSLEVVYPTVKAGDVDGSGLVDEVDAVLVLKHILGSQTITDSTKLKAANANGLNGVDMLDVIYILNNKSAGESDVVVDIPDTSDGTEVRTFSELKSALSKADAKVYVMNDIACEAQIEMSKGGQSIIGVPQSNGTLPVLDFEGMTGATSSIATAESGDGDVGIRIKSCNNVVKNLVVEHAHDNGIQLKDPNSNKSNAAAVTGNLIENCILRYNNDSGLQITVNAYGNTVKNVYSYRNCDVFTGGGNADGFAVKLGAGPGTTSSASSFQNSKNTFENCFAWDNGDDGWDSFDKENQSYWTYKIDYTNCMCWRNGRALLHVGYTDYANGLQLDEELPVIRRIKELVSDSTYNSFVTAYNNGNLGSRSSSSAYLSAAESLLGVKIPMTYTVNNVSYNIEASLSEYIEHWGGNPNGFKIGSKYTQSITERTLTNCIAFDHNACGFDKNNSACYVELDNCISFSNNINYHLSGCTARAFSNVYGWSGTKSNDLPTAASGVSVNVKTPASTSDTETSVRSAADTVVAFAAENKFTATNIFDKVF